MSEQLKESLSAAIDSEADAFELRRVLDEAKHDEALREQWHRLHLLRDVMREDLKIYHQDLRQKIWDGLLETGSSQEDVAELVLAETQVEKARQRSPWAGRLTGGASAAAVAVVVMFNGGVFDTRPVQEIATNAATSNTVGNTNNLSAPVLYQQVTPVDRQRQEALMLHHIQQRAMNQAGVASCVKMATFNSSRNLPVRAGLNSEDR